MLRALHGGVWSIARLFPVNSLLAKQSTLHTKELSLALRFIPPATYSRLQTH